MKTIVALIFTFLPIYAAFSTGHVAPVEENFARLKTIRNEQLGLHCTEPEDLHPAAKVLIKEYTENHILNSTFFSDFMWLHPEYEEFISCIICAVERPNDTIWESDFDTVCPEKDSIYSSLPEEEISS